MAKTKKIDWLNHFLEFIVVIIGILIAFQLNTCSEEKNEQKLVDRHLENIIKETEFNRRSIENSMKYNSSLVKKSDSMLVFMMEERELDSINAYSLDLLSLSGAYIRNNAYNSLIESSDIRLLQDFKLKNDIINLYEFYTWVESFDMMNVDSFNRFFYPYMIENLDLIEGTRQNQDIYFSKKFKNTISAYCYQLKAKDQKYEEVLNKIDEFLETHK